MALIESFFLAYTYLMSRSLDIDCLPTANVPEPICRITVQLAASKVERPKGCPNVLNEPGEGILATDVFEEDDLASWLEEALEEFEMGFWVWD